MNTGKKYYMEIDALKGFAIFLVVLGHAIIQYPINLHNNEYCLSLFKFLSSVHMPLFFLISGFCFSYHGNYKDFILKKVKRLVVPYVIFNILDIIPRQILSQFVNRPQSIVVSVKGMLLNGGEYWFLYTLFIIFLIYPAIYKWQIKSRTRMVVVMIILFVLAIVEIRISIFRLSSVKYYLLFFNIGVLLKVINIKIFDFKFSKIYMLIPLGLVVIWGLLLFSPLKNYFSILIALIGIVTCYFLTQFNIFNKVFERFGKFSLQLYLLNGFLLVISRAIICKITDMPFVIIIFNMAIDFVLSYVIIKYICNRVSILRKVMGIY